MKFQQKLVKDTVLTELYTPTQIANLYGYYFIVDCWHHRILYSEHMYESVCDWRVLDDITLSGPHSIASDGELFVVDNTDRHQLNVYKFVHGSFELIQVVISVGNRPHKVVFCQQRKLFVVLSSYTQELYIFVNNNGLLQLHGRHKLNELAGVYCRSFCIVNYDLLVCGANGDICTYDIDAGFNFKSKITISDKLTGRHGLNEIAFIDNAYYLSATPSVLLKAKCLNSFTTGEYEVVKFSVAMSTPYYFTSFDNAIWVCSIALPPEFVQQEHEQASYIIAISAKNEADCSTESNRVMFFSPKPNDKSITRKNLYPESIACFDRYAGVILSVFHPAKSADFNDEYVAEHCFITAETNLVKGNVAMKLKLDDLAMYYYLKVKDESDLLYQLLNVNIDIINRRANA
jgi:hypothetical protein